MKPLTAKQLDKRVDDIFARISDNVQLDIFDLEKIAQAGKDAYNAGRDIEKAMQDAIVIYRKD